MHLQVYRGDIKEHLLAYTDIKFPSVEEKDYKLMLHLRRGMDMLTFDRRDEKKSMGVVAGSYLSFKGNIIS